MNIVIIQGHPDGAGGHYCHALADAYAKGAAEGGHPVRRIEVAKVDFQLLRSQAEWMKGAAPPDILAAQADIAWAEHFAIVYPLWLGGQPALLKGFLEQAFRPGFAFEYTQTGTGWTKKLTGRSSRIIVTMGMPALIYRWYFNALTLRSLEQNILDFVGIGPNRHTIIGSVEAMGAAKRADWLRSVEKLGNAAR
jgi:putative NADPH-quinone reductase